MEWRGGWHLPLELPKPPAAQPTYKAVLAKWCSPMWWPPCQISEGRLLVWWKPGDKHRPVLTGQEAWLGDTPAVPPKKLETPSAPRPEAAHPGEEPPKSHLALAEKAYTRLGEYEGARMRAYAHLKMPAPVIDIMQPRTLRSDALYQVRVVSPNCELCHDKQVNIKHRRYLELYPWVPFECLHKQSIQDLVIEEEESQEKGQLPEQINRLMPD